MRWLLLFLLVASVTLNFFQKRKIDEWRALHSDAVKRIALLEESNKCVNSGEWMWDKSRKTVLDKAACWSGGVRETIQIQDGRRYRSE
jgi:hypothetical protein